MIAPVETCCYSSGSANELLGIILDTFSPTIGALSYAAVHQIAILDTMHSCSMDVTGAYLYQDYPASAPQLYLQLPDNVANLCGETPGQLYHIRKYLYGLPDAGRAYYKAYCAHLLANGYVRTASDPCLFVYTSGEIRTYAFCHVDDIFLCSTHASELQRFQTVVSSKFKITINNPITDYLGIHIEQLADGGCILTQPRLLETIVAEYRTSLPTSTKRTIAPQRQRTTINSYYTNEYTSHI